MKYFELVRIFQNNRYSNVASFYERGNRNEIVHIFSDHSYHKVDKFIELSKWLRISNLFLSFGSTLQLVVLDGRIAATIHQKL